MISPYHKRACFLPALRSYKSGGREDLVAKEQEELDVYSSYLPKMLTREELEAIVNKAVVDLGASSLKDMKKVMSEVKTKKAPISTL